MVSNMICFPLSRTGGSGREGAEAGGSNGTRGSWEGMWGETAKIKGHLRDNMEN